MESNMTNLITKFLQDTDESGRFVVRSDRTGRTYFVEPMGEPRTNWGSVDPATKKLVNKPGFQKYRGSIDEKDSLITEENGFKNIRMLPPGTSPLAAIEFIDSQYPDKQ
jgi:hypothetical protein